MNPQRVFPLLDGPYPCPGCGAQATVPLHVFPVNHAKRRVTRQLNLALVGCERCGLVTSQPFPTDADLAAYYGRDTGWDERIAAQEADLERRLARRRDAHARHLAVIRRHVALPAIGADPRPRAFDFGCGIGGWLEALKAEGWDTYGIEPGPRAAAISAERHTLLDAVPAEPTFDLVIVHHTLEHLRDPGATLERLTGALRDGGVIWISVPDLERLGVHRDFVYVAGDKHLCSFTSASLRALLALNGVELVSHSNDPSWGEPAAVAHDRLACIGRRVASAPALPEHPLETAATALRAYGAGVAEPQPARPRSRLRRLARRLSSRVAR